MAKQKKNYDGEIPFDKNGNMEHYPSPDYSVVYEAGTNRRLYGQEFHAAKAAVAAGSKDFVMEYHGPDWKQNFEFPATLTFTGFGRGRSAAYGEFQCGQVRKYTMFLTDLEELLKSNTLDRGVVSGIWTFAKRGMNFGIRKIN